jgi:hypothetical protein
MGYEWKALCQPLLDAETSNLNNRIAKFLIKLCDLCYEQMVADLTRQHDVANAGFNVAMTALLSVWSRWATISLAHHLMMLSMRWSSHWWASL